MSKPIFCIVGESGSGKSTYLDLILNHKHDKIIKELKYCTTRTKRYREEDSYYFMTNEEYNKIKPADIIECRTYQKYDELVRYFTLKENLEVPDCDALICAASVDQVLSYVKYLDNVYIIDIKVNLKERLNRLLDRANNDTEILEICRRTLQEQEEYDKLKSIDKNIIHIYNDNSKFKFDSSGNMLYAMITMKNLETIENYIKRNL